MFEIQFLFRIEEGEGERQRERERERCHGLSRGVCWGRVDCAYLEGTHLQHSKTG